MLPHEAKAWLIPKLSGAGLQVSLAPADHPLTDGWVRISSQTFNGVRAALGGYSLRFVHSFILEIQVEDIPGADAMDALGPLFALVPADDVEDIWVSYGTNLTFVSEGSGFLNPTTAQVTVTLEYEHDG